MEKLITVIIPTLNRPKLLLNLLRQIERESRIVREVFVVNTSSFNNIKIPELIFPLFTFKETNLLRGKNLALRKVRTPFVLILDDDLILSKNCIKNLLLYIQNKQLDVVSGFLIENKKYTKFINPQYLKFTFYKLAFINHKNISNNTESVDFLPGGFMLARTKVLLELGGWDTNFLYPFYNEDTDIAYRIKKAGYKLGFTNHSRAFHLKAKGGVRKELDKNFFYAFGFNNSYHYLKNFGFFYYFLYSIFTFRDVFFVLRQHNLYYIVEYIKGIIYGIKKAKNFSIASKL